MEHLSSPVVIAVGVAIFTALGWVVSFATLVLKGKAWVEETSLRTMRSAEGREAILHVVSEHSDRLEEKLSDLSDAIDHLGARLEGRIDQMSGKIEGRLDRLDKNAHDLDVRMALVEEGRTVRRA